MVALSQTPVWASDSLLRSAPCSHVDMLALMSMLALLLDVCVEMLMRRRLSMHTHAGALQRGAKGSETEACDDAPLCAVPMQQASKYSDAAGRHCLRARTRWKCKGSHQPMLPVDG